MSTDVIILRSSRCASGSSIKQQRETLADEHNSDLSIEELSDIQETATYGISTFPLFDVDGQVYGYCKLSSEDEIFSSLNQ